MSSIMSTIANTTIADIVRTTKTATNNTVTFVETKAVHNPVSNRVRDFRITRLVNQLTNCNTLEDEMPIRRQLIKLYNMQ